MGAFTGPRVLLALAFATMLLATSSAQQASTSTGAIFLLPAGITGVVSCAPFTVFVTPAPAGNASANANASLVVDSDADVSSALAVEVVSQLPAGGGKTLRMHA